MADVNQNQVAVFNPGIFEVSNMQQAMAIVLTPEPGMTTEERWGKETPYLVADIGKRLALHRDSCVLDYGCGPGRVAKGLIETYGCRVVGVDLSQSMRLLAPEYVLSERFVSWSPETLEKMAARGFRVDAAICLWVLQHALDPMDVIRRTAAALTPGGMLYSLNMAMRCVPTNRGWVNDGFNIRGALCAAFEELAFHSLPVEVTTPHVAAHSMIQVLRKPGRPG
jgi:SAM-dependent methyltransferase